MERTADRCAFTSLRDFNLFTAMRRAPSPAVAHLVLVRCMVLPSLRSCHCAAILGGAFVGDSVAALGRLATPLVVLGRREQ